MDSPLNQEEKDLITYLMSDKQAFDAFVYTGWKDALTELELRQKSHGEKGFDKGHLPNGVPHIMQGKKSMVLFRNIATPNYEMARFISSTDSLDMLQPIIFEYTKDKFNNRNSLKFALGKMSFQRGLNAKSERIYENRNILDINLSNNKRLDQLYTHWGQSLLDFHHEIFLEKFPQMGDKLFDLSDWLEDTGHLASRYYISFLSLFITHGILLENFLLSGSEALFTKEVILPTLIQIHRETGFKPLIVALDPPSVEGDKFWLSYPFSLKSDVDNKMQ